MKGLSPSYTDRRLISSVRRCTRIREPAKARDAPYRRHSTTRGPPSLLDEGTWPSLRRCHAVLCCFSPLQWERSWLGGISLQEEKADLC